MGRFGEKTRALPSSSPSESSATGVVVGLWWRDRRGRPCSRSSGATTPAGARMRGRRRGRVALRPQVREVVEPSSKASSNLMGPPPPRPREAPDPSPRGRRARGARRSLKRHGALGYFFGRGGSETGALRFAAGARNSTSASRRRPGPWPRAGRCPSTQSAKAVSRLLSALRGGSRSGAVSLKCFRSALVAVRRGPGRRGAMPSAIVYVAALRLSPD